MVLHTWLDIKHPQVFVNTIVLAPAYKSAQVPALTIVSELGVRRRLPFDPNVIKHIVLNVTRQMIKQDVEAVLGMDPVHCRVGEAVIFAVEPSPEVVEAVDVVCVREPSDIPLVAVAEGLGDTDVAAWVFAKDSQVFFCDKEWIAFCELMPCCIDFWTRSLLPDSVVGSCKEGNIGMIPVDATIDCLDKRRLECCAALAMLSTTGYHAPAEACSLWRYMLLTMKPTKKDIVATTA